MEGRARKRVAGKRGGGEGVADFPVEYLFNAGLSIKVAVKN